MRYFFNSSRLERMDQAHEILETVACPVTHLLPHHRYVCIRHRYWIGLPDIDQPVSHPPGRP
jgi:hypothetical protein